MISLLNLPASLRIAMFVFETLTASALLFGIIYNIMFWLGILIGALFGANIGLIFVAIIKANKN